MAAPLLAHSAPHPDAAPQLYADHVANVVAGARQRAEAMAAYCADPELARQLVKIVVAAAAFHDLGKLDNETQQALRRGRAEKLKWDHIDAGVAHLMAEGQEGAAWLVRAHHAPGLPDRATHFAGANGLKLRGRRYDEKTWQEHKAQRQQTDDDLVRLLAQHACSGAPMEFGATGYVPHGMPLRLSEACLVDADHSDTAWFDRGWPPPTPALPRWTERLAALDAYVAQLDDRGAERDAQRRAFYALCRHEFPADDALVACEGPVGIGKTTAVTAWLLRRAIATGARRLFVVAPYTNILTQTAQTLRDALMLPDERDVPELVVAEHHHRADFRDPSSRDLATLWNAPVILTTAVQFFETLASNHPSRLRKLHGLPGSVIFVDEAHAALPVRLWRQNWRWLRELTETWGCSAALASGSLPRFWTVADIVGPGYAQSLPVLGDAAQAELQRALEETRVAFQTAGTLLGPLALQERVATEPGPRLLIMNTVQSAAVMAQLARERGHDVLHLSSALSPRDRAAILDLVRRRLQDRSDADWTLVATSVVEAGVDISFRAAFRERFSTSSLLQVAGRVNRHGEYGVACSVIDFEVSHVERLTAHPEARVSGPVLGALLAHERLAGRFDAAALMSDALSQELFIAGKRDPVAELLVKAEQQKNYPEVAKKGRVITDETVLTVVDEALKARLAAGAQLRSRELLEGSVRLRQTLIDDLQIPPLPGRPEVFVWDRRYESDFLGYMAGVLDAGVVTGGEEG